MFAAFFMVVTISACDSKSRVVDPSPPASTASTATQTGAQSEPEAVPEPNLAPEVEDLRRFTEDIEGKGDLVALIDTDRGRIDCRLLEETAPKAVANFVGLARGLKSWRDPETDELVESRPFYEGVAFHYVVPGHFIQAGDRTGTGKGGPGYAFEDEIHLEVRHDVAGTLSMANTGPDTNGSQFFITERPAPHLDGRHTIFGRCRSLEVIKAIARVPTGPRDRPESPPRIRTIEFVRMAW